MDVYDGAVAEIVDRRSMLAKLEELKLRSGAYQEEDTLTRSLADLARLDTREDLMAAFYDVNEADVRGAVEGDTLLHAMVRVSNLEGLAAVLMAGVPPSALSLRMTEAIDIALAEGKLEFFALLGYARGAQAVGCTLSPGAADDATKKAFYAEARRLMEEATQAPFEGGIPPSRNEKMTAVARQLRRSPKFPGARDESFAERVVRYCGPTGVHAANTTLCRLANLHASDPARASRECAGVLRSWLKQQYEEGGGAYYFAREICRRLDVAARLNGAYAVAAGGYSGQVAKVLTTAVQIYRSVDPSQTKARAQIGRAIIMASKEHRDRFYACVANRHSSKGVDILRVRELTQGDVWNTRDADEQVLLDMFGFGAPRMQAINTAARLGTGKEREANDVLGALFRAWIYEDKGRVGPWVRPGDEALVARAKALSLPNVVVTPFVEPAFSTSHHSAPVSVMSTRRDGKKKTCG